MCVRDTVLGDTSLSVSVPTLLPGDYAHQYKANLLGKASSCKFGALQDEMVREQLIEH